jgi:hypothetical protein
MSSINPTIGNEADQGITISKIRLSWDSDPQSSIVIMFESSVQNLGKCEYGLTPSLGSQVVEEGSGILHEIRLTNLSPSSRYCYRVGVENRWSEIKTFKTAPIDTDLSVETQFIVWGDSRVETDEERLQRLKIVELSASFNPDFHIMSGDLVTGGAVDSMWDEWFEDFEPINSKAPIVVTPGNHEEIYLSENYRNYFAFPGNEYYFSYDYGPLHIVSLNSEVFNNYQQYGDYYQAQRDWLIRDLASTRKPWKIVTFHKPLYTSGTHYNDAERSFLIDAWEPIFKQYNVDIILNGHDHHYERSYKDGITYVTAGGAGAPLRWARLSRNPYSQFQRSVFHTCLFEANYTNIKMTAYTLDNATMDGFELVKKDYELAVTNMETTETPTNTSSVFGVIAEVTNGGSKRAENVSVSFNHREWSWSTTVSLNPGQSMNIISPSNITKEVNISTVQVNIDPSNVWIENNERNNIFSLELILPNVKPDLTIKNLVLINSSGNPTDRNVLYGLDIWNLGLTTVNSTSLSILTENNVESTLVDIGSVPGLGHKIIEVGTMNPSEGILLNAVVDPTLEIDEGNEVNNRLYLGYNMIFNQTTKGATFQKFIRPDSSFTISYEPSVELSSAAEIGFIWSTDGWTTMKSIPLTKLGNSWCGKITPSERMYGLSFGFTGDNKTDFAGHQSWTILQNFGLKGHIDFPRIIEVSKTPKLRFLFLTTENYSTVNTEIKGWVEIDGTRYMCSSHSGFMELDLNQLSLTTNSYDCTVYSWTENFEPIMVLKSITLFYPESKTNESTTSGRTGIRFSMWVIISLLTLISYKKRKN